MKSGGFFDRDSVEKEISELEKSVNSPDFWNDSKSAQKISKRVQFLRNKLENIKKTETVADDIEMYRMILEEDFSEESLREAVYQLESCKEEIEAEETAILMNGSHDDCDAILVIHPGAGGTESQDWAEMLYRMYRRWSDKSNHKIEEIELSPGDEAGIKSATLKVSGENAFGELKCEAGIHRLVRISPFNAQGKRQTSFASVFVYPLIEEEIEIEIAAKDLRIDTYRAGGKGGQCVNTTDSAVRITHLPTGTVVQCQNERSQLKNKEFAMKVLKARLYQKYEEEQVKEKDKLAGNKTEIGWGNQIRSYVFHPYQMVKDHRTNFETGNISAVMDGDLSGFINAYLKYSAEKSLLD
ncbi:MAG: peptide chain release factor 2 [Candidatus Cloacimonadota bacterium]|nr:MAG: peptide chain release factor 2 [Candidatus Cloacimonadota bacterium]